MKDMEIFINNTHHGFFQKPVVNIPMYTLSGFPSRLAHDGAYFFFLETRKNIPDASLPLDFPMNG